MYQAHFGLQKRLFEEGIAAETAAFRSAQHEQLIARFKLALGSATSVIALRGPAGVGKSTLTSAALRASSTRLALAWLNGSPANPTELLELLLIELGVNAARATRIERLQLWRQFQSEMGATDSRLFVVVERTEDLSAEVLHALDSLTAADAAGHPGANVVLLGHRELDAHLAAPALDSLRQRIRLRAELKPFTEAELQEYLRHQIVCAGGDYDRLCAPGTVAMLHRYSGGVARLANNLCETALTLTASRGRSLLTPELLKEAAVELLGLADLTPPAPVTVVPVAVTSPVVASSAAPALPPSTPVPAPSTTTPSRPTSVAVEPVPAVPAPAVNTPSVGAPIASTASARVSSPPISSAPPAPAASPLIASTPSPLAASPVPPPPSPPAPAPVSPAPSPTVSAAPRTVPPPASRVVVPPPPTMPPSAATSAASTGPVAAAPLVERRAQPRPVSQPPVEFDGEATDIPDVELTDFPVLTDAVDLPPPAPATPKRPAAPAVTKPPAPPPVVAAPPTPPSKVAAPSPAAPPAAKATPAPAPRPAAAVPPSPLNPIPAAPSAPTPRRVETAYAASRATTAPAAAGKSSTPAATPAAPAPSTAKAPLPPKPSATVTTPPPPPRAAPEPAGEEDVLKQTQTMRAIAAAKSIDDISSSMAETLFGDAELDLLTAALESAAGWAEDESAPEAPPVKAAAKAVRQPAIQASPVPQARQAAPVAEDDLLDLLGLGDDAPLELIDDDAPPAGDRPRKAAG